MAYTRVNWQDLPSTSTPRNATNLNNMDAGIKENDERLNGTKSINNTIYANDFKCKNLWPLVGSQTVSGITFTKNNDGTFNLKGTATSDITIRAWFPLKNLEDDSNYTISSSYIVSGLQFRVEEYSSLNGTWVKQYANLTSNTNNPLTFKISKREGTYARCAIFISSGTTLDGSNIKLQLEPGTEATEYTEHKDFDNEEIYSTGERVVGIWIDGKPVYEKSFERVLSTTYGSYLMLLDVNNVKALIESNGSIYSDEKGECVPINSKNLSNDELWSKLDARTHQLRIMYSSDMLGWNFSATVRYTKTTD